MTIKKEIKKKLIFLIKDEKNLPINEEEFKANLIGKSFPNNFIFEFKEKIYVCLYIIQSSTILEFNHNLIWAGVKLFNFSRNKNYKIINPEVIDRPENLYLGWCLGDYDFSSFRSKVKKKKRLNSLT